MNSALVERLKALAIELQAAVDHPASPVTFGAFRMTLSTAVLTINEAIAALADASVPPQVVVEILERGTDEVMGRLQPMDQQSADKMEAGVKVDLDTERYYTRQVIRGIHAMTPEHIRRLQTEGHSVLAHKYHDLAECPVCSTQKRPISIGQDWVSRLMQSDGPEVSVIGADVNVAVPPATAATDEKT